jgi:OmpA-OmpF porin, OOP family
LRGKLSASEKNHPTAWRQDRGFNFETNLTEISAVLEWEFLTKGRLSAFAFGGGGATFFNPKTNFNTPNKYVADVNPDLNTNYSKVTAAIPLGFGLKYSLPKDFYLSAEVGYRFVFTDYLDGISKTGNPNKKDTYYYTGLTLTKAFGGGKSIANRLYKAGDSSCPKFF